MKIHYHKDQLRIRLTPPEVMALEKGRTLEHATLFGTQSSDRHAFRVEPAPDGSDQPPIRVSFDAGTVTLQVGQALVAGLANEESIGQEVAQKQEGAPTLRILLERDLKPRRG